MFCCRNGKTLTLFTQRHEASFPCAIEAISLLEYRHVPGSTSTDRINRSRFIRQIVTLLTDNNAAAAFWVTSRRSELSFVEVAEGAASKARLITSIGSGRFEQGPLSDFGAWTHEKPSLALESG
jgi:hypothetical protein